MIPVAKRLGLGKEGGPGTGPSPAPALHLGDSFSVKLAGPADAAAATINLD